ncbi:hypothetical protein BDW02DRAFT_519000 [Decorospora gaudefroyi]|uniref:WD40 repeat-like protein n=1 Tax=Decorospora gaudefroyi TaxID=184978 RepID=A0A6A5KGN4_9PLEO|nr:hypothetical protein BDW02DRAFT_519000 [Decorospora gaudefroyi]
MDISTQYKSTSPSIPSPTGTHIASLNGARLQIRCLTTFEITRSIPMPSSHDIRTSKIVWSPPTLPLRTPSPSTLSTPSRRSSRTPRPCSHRILVSDDDNTRVYDLRDEKWSAVISNGSGGMGKNVHVEFGAREDEVMIWSDFAACLKIWCLKTGRTVEVRDPKFVGRDGKGWGYRGGREGGGGGVLALLCRSAGADVLLLLAPRTYTVLSRIELPTTDAAGLRWSRDGRWLAIWDAASAGYKLCIYTADGHLYRTLSREVSDEVGEWDVESLGIKTLEWLPGNDRLAVGGWDRRVRILSTRTFAPVVFLDHTATIHVPAALVYTEHVDRQGTRSFVLTQQPVTPPKAALDKNETGLMKQGVGMLTFNAEGTMCATREDSTPCTVWVWDLRTLRPKAIFFTYAPIKTLSWHPVHPDKLLVQTAQDEPTVYLYTASKLSTSPSSTSISHPPDIINLSTHMPKPPGSAPTAKWITSWLSTAAEKKPVLFFGHQHSHVLVWPDGKDQILRFERQADDDDGDDGEESDDDSLFDILTGRTPVPRLQDDGGGCDTDRDMQIEEEDAFGDTVLGLDDTFRGKREGVVVGARDESVFESSSGGGGVLGESGIDEMF